MAIELISELTLKNNQDFPLLDTNNLRGGYYQVSTLLERDAIPNSRRKEGMLCYVLNDPNSIYVYLLLNSKWEKAKIGSQGIPIYTEEMLQEFGDSVENNYIYLTVPDKSDVNGTISNLSFTTSKNGSYVDILFSAIRALLNEVAKLRNSFIYGINSYTGTDTAMSTSILGVDEEPLWAIDEEELSDLTDINQNITFIPSGNVILSSGNYIFNGTASWENEGFKDIEDPKLFCYLTTSDLDVDFGFKNKENELRFNLNDLNLYKRNKYNIVVIVSRFLTINNIKKGKSYVWISILDYESGNIISSGYLDTHNKLLRDSVCELEDNYYFSDINFTDLTLSKFLFYSKYQDFSNSIIPVLPTDLSYKYNAASITIRTVPNKDTLVSIKNLLLDGELIWVQYPRALWIKDKGILNLVGSIGSDEPTDSGMTAEEMLATLTDMGIISNDNGTLTLNNISDVTFIHNETNKKFRFLVNAEGDLYSLEIPSNTLTSEYEAYIDNFEDKDFRGFIGQLNKIKKNLTKTNDFGLYSDRLKIGAVYAPLESDTVHGCSHAYIELENTSDVDIPLQGFYLHYAHGSSTPESTEVQIEHLALTGTIKAGSTYLIRGKQYSNFDEAFIKVDSYDQEWYVENQLLDLTCESGKGYALALTIGEPELSYNTELWFNNTDVITNSKATYTYPKYYIDSMVFYGPIKSNSKTYWAKNTWSVNSNTIIKNTFELDPAKLAFLALNMYDSSRIRNDKLGTDAQYLSLAKDKIEFPHSDDTYKIDNYTPKSSKLNKNVSTDKSKLDRERPNMVTCSFGIDIYTTRCFNWISCGEYDEYVFIKYDSGWKRFQSYKQISKENTQSVYYPRRKEFSVDVNNAIYANITGRFPGDNSFYTSHKCIIDIAADALTAPNTYTYVVGRADKNGNPDFEHCSEEYTFTLNPKTYTPKVYQITDQLGFHWIEYLVWAAAANKINSEISSQSNIIPIIINTGDMTLNGTRINEWLDYYNAGKPLFKKYELMNIVGNNDLCGTNPYILGTGDDIGKSNSFYFHIFYCYEVDSTYSPIINGKYVPSLYYFDTLCTKDPDNIVNYRFLMVNSELTVENCRNWFGLIDDANLTINAYTGWSIPENSLDVVKYNDSFTSIYTLLYNYTNDSDKNYIAVCHEMPFTVITNANLKDSTKGKARSVSGSSLVGSHLNLINVNDSKGTYWFSRLLEYRGIKLCIGGHKHTYACTYPLREYYYYGDNSNSLDNGPMNMQSTLENDNVTWIYEGKDLTKFPLTKRTDPGTANTGEFYPCTAVSDLDNGIVYFMCQATGYKLTSNKELPSANLKYSEYLPKTTVNNEGSDVADNNLKYPMFGEIEVGSNIKIDLVRIENIFNNKFKFTLSDYSTDTMQLKYLSNNNNDGYGVFVSSKPENSLITL